MSVEAIEDTNQPDFIDRKIKRCWPWPEMINYFYDVDNSEIIMLEFNSSGDWEDCKKTPEFQGAFDFDNLDFFYYLNVDFCNVIRTITK